MNWNWFLHRTVRHSTQMRRHVRKLINAQRDILKPEAIEAVEESMDKLASQEEGVFNPDAMNEGMQDLEKVAHKWLKPYPNAGMRENIEVLLVAIAVAMAIRTFFLQPFKIPTGSMQPTLWGIMNENLIQKAEVDIPGRWNPRRFIDYWINGVGYTHEVATDSGRFQIIDEKPTRFLLFNLKQRFRIGKTIHTVWFPPDNLWKEAQLKDSTGIPINRTYNKGEDVIRLRTVSGDHLFVDRFTYNWRRPKRGEIIVFETRGIRDLPQDQYYIKRLVATEGETVSLANDRRLVIDGKKLSASTPLFELVYSFDPNEDAIPDEYSGHVNGAVARTFYNKLSPLFPGPNAEFTVPPGQYLVMGDNTLKSYDSRAWGGFSKKNVIGKSFFVYWPIGAQPGQMGRFGWSHR